MRNNPIIWVDEERGLVYRRDQLMNYPSFGHKMARDMIFQNGKTVTVDKALLNLAARMIRGDRDFTDEELQLQANEPEKLENMLRELKEWMDKNE